MRLYTTRLEKKRNNKTSRKAVLLRDRKRRRVRYSVAHRHGQATASRDDLDFSAYHIHTHKKMESIGKKAKKKGRKAVLPQDRGHPERSSPLSPLGRPYSPVGRMTNARPKNSKSLEFERTAYALQGGRQFSPGNRRLGHLSRGLHRRLMLKAEDVPGAIRHCALPWGLGGAPPPAGVWQYPPTNQGRCQAGVVLYSSAYSSACRVLVALCVAMRRIISIFCLPCSWRPRHQEGGREARRACTS